MSPKILKKAKPNKRSAVDYERLGRQIEATYLTGALDRKRLIKNSFLRGLAAGFGGVIGATIVVGLLLWLLSLLDTAPFVGPIFDNLQEAIESRQ